MTLMKSRFSEVAGLHPTTLLKKDFTRGFLLEIYAACSTANFEHIQQVNEIFKSHFEQIFLN